MARQSVRQEAAGSHHDTLEVEVRHTDRAVRVTLSGILDEKGVRKMAQMVSRRLLGRETRIILDGAGLAHLDYRACADLLRWHRKMRGFGHQVFLQNWSSYLQAILLMEDWDNELSSHTLPCSPLHLLGNDRIEAMP
jgi:ABC-type transporter Mla MlaB component